MEVLFVKNYSTRKSERNDSFSERNDTFQNLRLSKNSKNASSDENKTKTFVFVKEVFDLIGKRYHYRVFYLGETKM